MKKQIISLFKMYPADERLTGIMTKVNRYDWTELAHAGRCKSATRSFTEKTYNNFHRTEMAAGGYFAASKQPELMPADLRKFVASVPGRRL